MHLPREAVLLPSKDAGIAPLAKEARGNTVLTLETELLFHKNDECSAKSLNTSLQTYLFRKTLPLNLEYSV